MICFAEKFPLYTEFNTTVEVRCVTSGNEIHRFFDTSPISPSGQYLAVLRIPYENRNPLAGDRAEIVLIDLVSGEEEVLYQTAGWEMQVGANLQWGSDDNSLFFNDVDTKTWRAFGVRMNPFTKTTYQLDGCIFEISKSGKFAATTCPLRARFSQPGYGVVIPNYLVPQYKTASEKDGLFITNTHTGKCHLLLSIKEITESLSEYFNEKDFPHGGEFFGFQCKWNCDDSRLLLVIRWLSPDKKVRKNQVLTLTSDGSNLRVAIPFKEWAKGGHHIAWHPDGQHLTMNINVDGDGLRFIIVNYDGTGYEKLSNKIWGSGHPSVHKSGKYLITDSYTTDYGAYSDGTTAIRLISFEEDKEYELLRMLTKTPYDFSLRLDPHPAWDKSGRYITFNGYHENIRRVYIADVQAFLPLG